MEKIYRLTPEQERQMVAFREEWRQIGLGTGAANIAALRPILADFYAAIGEPAPYIWRCESPLMFHLVYWVLKQWGANLKENLGANLGANLGDHLVTSLGANLWENLGNGLGANLGANLGNSLGNHLCKQLKGNLGANLGNSLGASLEANLWENLGGHLWDNLKDKLKPNTRIKYTPTYFWGSLDSYWIAYYLFPHLFLREMHTQAQMKRLMQWAEIARNSFWWYPYRGICFVCDRPEEYHFDEQWRLHNSTGPAVRFSDGWALYAVHGVMLPSDVIERPEGITVQRIENERNIEVRRVMIECYGLPRYLQDSGAELVHSDGYGDLYRKEQANDEPLVMVRVVNSTPEPNGEYRDYFLRVPPTIQTAEAAVAWSFGLEAGEYHPSVET